MAMCLCGDYALKVENTKRKQKIKNSNSRAALEAANYGPEERMETTETPPSAPVTTQKSSTTRAVPERPLAIIVGPSRVSPSSEGAQQKNYHFDSIQIILLLGIYSKCCGALYCFDHQIKDDGFLQYKTTCEGDVCVYYQPGAHLKFFEEKTCATGFHLPLGCQHSSIDNSTMCICNTDYCNHGGIDELVDTPMYNCHVDQQTWFDMGNHELRGEGNQTETGSFCITTSSIHAESNETEEFAGPMRGSEGYPVIPGNPDMSHFFFYPGIVHSFNLRNGSERSFMYKCHGDLCNNISIFNLPEPKTINCFDDEIPGTEKVTCQGEFCVFAKDRFWNFTSRYCLSTYNLHSDHSYKAGVYKYKTAAYYLCQEDGCNYNETTAYKNITLEEEEPKIAHASFWSIALLEPEHLLIALSVLSCTTFLTLFGLVAMFVPMDPKYAS